MTRIEESKIWSHGYLALLALSYGHKCVANWSTSIFKAYNEGGDKLPKCGTKHYEIIYFVIK